MLDIESLRALMSVEKCGSVTKSALHLGLSQSTVSHQLSRLETKTGSAMFLREGHGLKLTVDGNSLLHYARRIVGLHDEALASLHVQPVSGSVNFGLANELIETDIIRILGRFQRLYPAVNLKTWIDQASTIETRLATGSVDLAAIPVLRECLISDDSVLCEEELLWVKSQNLTLNFMHPVPLISFGPDNLYTQWAMSVGSAEKCTFETAYECPTAPGIRHAVRSGMGVALMRRSDIDKNMVIVKGDLPAPPKVVFVIRKPVQSSSEPTDFLLEYLFRSFGGKFVFSQTKLATALLHEAL
ncbi:LysR family transcriptional regulator [Falsiruegeria litorea]|nr:LysR family transcriptional regulator [Falsiruegeria litorea]